MELPYFSDTECLSDHKFSWFIYVCLYLAFYLIYHTKKIINTLHWVIESLHPKMNHHIFFMLVLTMCFGFKESFGCAPNSLQFRNQLGKGHLLTVNCWSNRGETHDTLLVLPNGINSISVNEKGSTRIVWKCQFNDGKSGTYLIIWRAYRGATRARCGQIREYIAELKGVSLMRNNKPTKEFFTWIKGQIID